MLTKLSLRNAKRQAKDYIIYFITIVMAVSLMFSFNCLAMSKDIEGLSEMMNGFSSSISVISLLIMVIMAWLINYTMKFMLEKRSKEFGTYELLGIEKRAISNMFTIENLMIGMIAFIVGVGIGTLLYQVFTSIIMNIFQQPYEITIQFSLRAIGITALYFFGIFLLVLGNNRRKIQKTKVYELLYAEKKNENNKIKSTKGNTILFFISILLFALALIITKSTFKTGEDVSGFAILIALILLIVGIYLFYISIASYMVRRYLSNKKRKYKGNTMFLYRNLTSKINTMSITMGTIAMLFTFIIIGGSVALLMNTMLNNELELSYPFEIMISGENGDFSNYQQYIEEHAKIKSMHTYKMYNVKPTSIHKALDNTFFEKRYYEEFDKVLALTDYNKLREMLGYEKVSLSSDEVILQCMTTAKKIFEDYIKENKEVSIAGKNYRIKEIKDEHFAQVSFNGYTYCLIVPDEILPEIAQESEDLRKKIEWEFDDKLVVQTEEATDRKFFKELSKFIPKEYVPRQIENDGEVKEYNMEISLGNVQTRGARVSETRSFYTIISFLSFYVALIFVMATATLLAIQQLSDSEKYKYRYALLKKLGVDETQINSLIRKQLLIYFVLPMFIPILVSIPAVLLVGNIFMVGITIQEIWSSIGIVIGLFLLVYSIYFVATDIQFNRNINGNW